MSLGNAPLDIEVNGARVLRLELTASNSFYRNVANVIAGSPVNFVSPGVIGATIAGGGNGTSFGVVDANSISASFGTISGGTLNTIQEDAFFSTIAGGDGNTIGPRALGSTIAGGYGNTNMADAVGGSIGGGTLNLIGPEASLSTIAGGEENIIQYLADHSTIGGGLWNTIGTNAYLSTIAGGGYNTIHLSSQSSVIGGGAGNTVASISSYATIPGGRNNHATNSAFAAGTRAKANHKGSFVWGDATEADIVSTDANSMTFRASGGVRIFSGTNATTGVFLAPGSGGWTTMSHRRAKENVQPADSRVVLEKLAALPL